MKRLPSGDLLAFLEVAFQIELLVFLSFALFKRPAL
jgi:hypothetical protein